MEREKYITEIIQMIHKLDQSDEIFIKQLYIIVKKHFVKKRGR